MSDGDRLELALDPEVEAFFERVSSEFGRPPSEAVSGRHLAAIRAELDARPTGPTRRTRLVLAFAAVFVALGVLVGGLAYAGVITLPSSVRGVFHFMRFDAPVQRHEQQAPATGADVTKAPQRPGQAAVSGSDTLPSVSPSAVPSVPTGDVAGATTGDSTNGGGSGDSPDHPGGDSCQIPPRTLEECLP